MSWSSVSNRMRNLNVTDGREYNNGQEVGDNPSISHTHCDYCEIEVLGVWDDSNRRSSYWPYLGNQARKPKVYAYSPIIQAMRAHDNATGEVWNNNLLNLHAKAHTYPNYWGWRAHPNGMKILCNDCFKKTYKRQKLWVPDRLVRVEITVMEEFGETLESVCEELGIPYDEDQIL